MLEKRDVIYYRRLAYTQGAIGIMMLCVCFVSGVSAKYHMAEIHAFAPYWIGIPLVLQGMVTMAAARSGKRWPLACWFPLFFLVLCGICAYMIILPPYKLEMFRKYPCFIQKNYGLDKTRCICSYNNYNYLQVDNAENVEPCVRALNIMMIMGNINYAFAILALVPELLMFILVCNDLCCLSCRRAANVPQMILTGGVPQQQPQYVPVQTERITYRTDEQPGSSSGQRPTDQAGPLPTKPQNPAEVPCSF
ncbi:hypothetical protein ACHWQZ_G012138 [Mnemiopsis leidyi]